MSVPWFQAFRFFSEEDRKMAATVWTLRGAGALAAALAVTAVSFGQQNPARPAIPRTAPFNNQQQQQVQQQGGQRVTANKLATDQAARGHDNVIANWLAIGNQVEIAVSQAAERQTDNQDVKKFAETMVKDHNDLEHQLQRFGAVSIHFDENRQENGQRTAATQGAEPAQPLNFLEVSREIADRCVASARKELNEKKGNERDECYIGMQIAAHQHFLDTAKTLREYASPELQTVIDKGVQTAESHMEHAKHLIRELTKNQDRNAKDRESKS
jgi:predicted outer membrane protein